MYDEVVDRMLRALLERHAQNAASVSELDGVVANEQMGGTVLPPSARMSRRRCPSRTGSCPPAKSPR